MIYLEKKHLQEIIEHCQKEYPKEACGILAGKIVRSSEFNVERIYKMKNISENPLTCYFIEPTEQLKVFKEMLQLNLEMVAIYHSHSGTSAYPSQRDIEMAFYPEVSYIIISLVDFNKPKIRAYRIIDGKIKAEKICEVLV